MTVEQHVHSVLKSAEKSASKSKKFIFGAGVELILTAFVIIIFFRYDTIDWPLAMVLMLTIFTMGVIAMVFNGYQAGVDKYVRGAALGSIFGGKAGILKSILGGQSGRTDNTYEEYDEGTAEGDEGEGI